MANVLVTIKVLPESPEVSFSWLSEQVEPKIASVGKILKTERQPIAFGLNALLITFLMDESKGSTETLEKEISGLQGVSNVDVVDVRRAVG
jgi:elongation factor 1-beta